MARGIAYVTDDETIPADLQAIDRGEEFAVTTVPGTGRGVSAPLPEDTACVVVDHDPPAIDGLAAVAWVRDRYLDLPIVLYPTASSESLAAAAVNVDVDAYVRSDDGGTAGLLRSKLQRLTERTSPTTGGGADSTDADDPSTGDTGSEVATMFESILTSLPRWVSIYVKDRQGRHVAVSGPKVAFDEETVIQTADGKVLHSREDILGKTDFDLYSQALAKQSRKQEQRIMRTEEPDVNVTEVVDEPNGRTAYYSTTKAPWYGEAGNVAGIVGITVDITDRIERKQAVERQNERLDQFAGLLSHDIRNPLAVASGQVELLDELDLPEAAEDSLEDLEWSLDRIDSLIEDALALAREGVAVTDPQPTDLDAVVRAAWRAAGGDAGNLVVNDDLPTVSADPDRVQRLFENLFCNALEHGTGDDGEPATGDGAAGGDGADPVTISVGPTDDGFYVADDGCGVPEDQRDSVFEHGYSTTEDGTGFGLAIVAEIATAHEWVPSVTSSEEDGARFEFRGVTVSDEATS